MKKILFFSLAVAGMLTSCSSDDSVNMSGNEANIGSGVPIELTIGSKFSTSTRGTGTVGGLATDAAANKWHNQIVKVYMLKKNTMELATLTDGGTPIYEDEPFATPGHPFANMDPANQGPRQSGLARPTNSLVKYYPIEGNYDFYGYRIDDCTYLNAAGKPEVKDGDSLVVKFQMDGSQDIMAARAYVNDEEKAAAATNGNPLTDVNRYYSAYAARRGVQPRLDFKHLLTRLEFEVIPMGDDAVAYPGGVLIDSIKVLTDKFKGEFTIAKTSETPDSAFFKGDFQKALRWTTNATPTAADTVKFALMQRDTAWHYQAATPAGYENINIDSLNLVKLDSVDLRNRTQEVAVGVGEAMFVAPDETEYSVIVYTHQWTRKSYDASPIDTPSNLVLTKYELPAKIKLSGDAPFQQGYSYKVSIKVWGLKEIKLTTTLMGWIDGGGIQIAPEEDPNPYGWQ